MLRIVLLSALAALGAAQKTSGNYRDIAILAEERYLKTDGQFGAAYEQEDGVQFKETSDADGTRRGSYSYVDPSGQRRTVSYVAGKNGFEPVGDHLPAVPAAVVNPQPQYNSPAPARYNPAPQQQYNPAPQQYNPAPQPQYNPAPQPQYNPAPQPQYNRPQSNFGAPGDDDGQWVDDTRVEYPANSPSTFNNPAPQPSWSSDPLWNAGPTAAPAYNKAPAYNNAPAPAYNNAPAPVYNSAPTTTPAPHRFFPPGKLSLSRSPDGFSYTFNKS